MPDILKLPPQHVPCLYRQIRIFALGSLHARQFIHADRAFALLGSFGCRSLDLTALNEFLFPPLVGNFRQPIPEAVRLQSPYFSQVGGMLVQRSAQRCPAPSVRQRFLALSDFLIGRPAFIGASHAIAAI